jgi:succinyl-diaminopimelate desuccinylase
MTGTDERPVPRVEADDVVDLTLDLLSIDTANPPGDTREIVGVLETYLEDVPVETERFAVDPAKPNLLATVPGESAATLCFLGHLDTVPYDADEWTHDPLGEVDGEALYGRGATDMKGQVASMLAVLEAHAERAEPPPVSLTFAFVSDEEVGGDAGLPAVLSADLLDGDACVIGEPTCLEDRHSVTVADRGSIWLTMEATGEAAHGSRPVLGENAIDRLYSAIEQLRERFGTQELSLDDAVAAIVDESVAFYAPTMGEAAARELFTRPSINLGTIEGGDAINSVPASARAEIDVRLAPGIQTQAVLADIRACAADCRGVELTDVSWSVGTAEPVDSPLVDAVASTAESVLDERVYRRSATGGGDAKTLRNAGIPTVEFALSTDTVHAADEHTPVAALVDNAEIYARLPTAWAGSLAGA